MRNFSALVLIVAALSLVFYMWISRSAPRPAAPQAISPGTLAPEIKAQGWLNGPAPESLGGKVVVVDAWATWCGPCRAAAPDLVNLHAKYKDRGVVFIGLTAEGPEMLSEIIQFLDETGITWLNGYGAHETLIALEAYAIPSTWVIGPHGRIVWSGHPVEHQPLEQAIEQSLAAAQKYAHKAPGHGNGNHDNAIAATGVRSAADSARLRGRD